MRCPVTSRTFKAVVFAGAIGSLASLSLATGACASPTDDADTSEAAGTEATIDTKTLLTSFKPNEERQLWRKGTNKEGDWDLVAPNAYWAARLASISYEGMGDIPAALKAIGLDTSTEGVTYKPFEDPGTSTEAFYVATKDVAFLVFRGSQQKRDWQINLSMISRRGVAPGGRTHVGFSKAFDSVWNGKGMRDYLWDRHQLNGHLTRQATKGPPLYVVGHSLGGALALLATYSSVYDECIERKNWATLDGVDRQNDKCILQYIPIAATYTFGQPRVGDKTFAGDLGIRLSGINSPYYRFINTNDVVPDGPKNLPLFPYGHVGRYDLDPKNAELSFVSYLDYDAKYAFRAQPGRGKFHRDGCLEPISNHAIDDYANKILTIGTGRPYTRPICRAAVKWACDTGSGICACSADPARSKPCCDPAEGRCQVDATKNPACKDVCR
jgi:hypothetical protein